MKRLAGLRVALPFLVVVASASTGSARAQEASPSGALFSAAGFATSMRAPWVDAEDAEGPVSIWKILTIDGGQAIGTLYIHWAMGKTGGGSNGGIEKWEYRFDAGPHVVVESAPGKWGVLPFNN